MMKGEPQKKKKKRPPRKVPHTRLIHSVPNSEIPLQQSTLRFKSSSSSRFKLVEKGNQLLERIKLIKAATNAKEREELFILKVKQCCAVFDFTTALHNVEQKEIKRESLLELVEFILTERGFLTEPIYKEVAEMLRINLFRPLPPRLNPEGVEYDPEEDEPILEAAWPHLQIVYEFFLRFVEFPEFDAGIAKQYFNKDFVTNMLELFDSEDPRERDYLKTTLHRIYGRFLSLRSFIRRSIKNIFITFIYETERHNGIAELLEILGSIINGFTLPLKEEHKRFLVKALLPLHKSRAVGIYHPQLSYCITQYIEKDPSLAEAIFTYLIRFWPQVNSSKEILFLGEIEEILLVLDPKFFTVGVQEIAFKRIARSIGSLHFQVAEKALCIWNNEYILGLIAENIDTVLPVLFGTLYQVSKHHWNTGIRSLAYNSLKLFMEIDTKVFDEAVRKYKKEREVQKKRRVERRRNWNLVTSLAQRNGDGISFMDEEVDEDGNNIIFEDDNDIDPLLNELNNDMRILNLDDKLRRKSLLPLDSGSVRAMEKHMSNRGEYSDSDESDSDDYDDDDDDAYDSEDDSEDDENDINMR